VRVHCAEVLGRIRSKSSRGFLEKALSDEKSEVRTAAAAALADMGPGESAAAVVGALADPVLGVRIEAARALAGVEPSMSVPRLRAALDRQENGADTFRREAFFSLAAHGDREAVDRLSEMLDHESVPFRLVVASRLHLVTARSRRSTAARPPWRGWTSTSPIVRSRSFSALRAVARPRSSASWPGSRSPTRER
jgi:HEAT repeat protein